MIKQILVLGFSLLFLVGCNTKFSVNGEYEEKPIVHFLLDQGEEYHFLKLNKTYLKEGNALEYAKDPELSYFDDVEAVVSEVKNGNTIRSWTLQDTIINNKKPGIFYGPEQKLYFFKEANLDEDAVYQLEITIDGGKHIVTGNTPLVKDFNIQSPGQNIAFNFADNNVQTNGYKTTAISFSKGKGAGIYNGKLIMHYEEVSDDGKKDKTLVWNLGDKDGSEMNAGTNIFSAEGEKFYDYVSRRIENTPGVNKRHLRALEIVLTAGSEDLHTYMLTSETSSSTFVQSKPTYSNVDGGLGIFSSRVTRKQYKPVYIEPYTRCLSANSTKELCTGQYTAFLKFCSDIPLDNSKSYYCGD